MHEFWTALSNGNLIANLGVWNYLLIAILASMEGPAVTLIAATIAGAGQLNPWLVFLAAGAGNFSGDVGWYTLGYAGRFDTLKRYLPGLARFEPQISRLERDIHRRAVRLLLISKLTLSWATIPTIISAGMAHVPWARLLPAVLIAEVVWSGSLVLAGFYLGNYISSLKLSLEILAGIGGLSSVIIAYLYLRKFRTPA
jgi:membrane protein DedA with SNARE-associated domain